jgi:hypothetical protein
MKKMLFFLLILPINHVWGQYVSLYALTDSVQFAAMAGEGRAVVWSIQVNLVAQQLQTSHARVFDRSACVLVVGFRAPDEAESAAQGRAEQMRGSLRQAMMASSQFQPIPMRSTALPYLDRSGQPVGLELDITEVDYVSHGPSARVEVCLAPPEAMQWDTAQVAAYLQQRWQYQADRKLGPRLIPMRRGEYMGYVDSTGTWVIEPQFEDAGLFIAGRAWAKVKGNLGFIDPRGQWVIEPQYQSRTPHGIEHNNFNHLSHLVLLKNRDRFICLDVFGDTARWPMSYACGGAWGSTARGKLIGTVGKIGFKIYPNRTHPEPAEIPARYQAIRTAPNCIFVQKAGKWGTYNWQGELLLPCQYDSIVYLHDHHYGQRRFFSHHVVLAEGRQGIVSETGHELVTPRYEQIVPYLDYARAKPSGRPWVYLRPDGTELTEID